MSEQIVTGKKYRILTDVAQKVWQRVSFWTKSSDVEFNDGKTAETKVGAISGITDSLVSTSSNIAASAKAVSQLNGNLGRISNIGMIFTDYNGYALEKSIAYVIDRMRNSVSQFAIASFTSNDKWYLIMAHIESSGRASGIVKEEYEAAIYNMWRWEGADAVLKKLGSSAPSERLIRSNLSATTTINMADYCGDISKVTINDFLFTITNINAYCTSWGHPSNTHGPATNNSYTPVSGSYNAGTGILTVTISVPTYGSGTYGQTGGGNCKITPNVNVYFFG